MRARAAAISSASGSPSSRPHRSTTASRSAALDAHAGVAGAFEEQLDRRPRERIERVDGGHLERSQRHDGLAGQLQRRSAGGEHRGLLADLEDAPDRAGRRLEEVLAVVDEEQRLAIAGRVEQGLERLEAELRGEGAAAKLRAQGGRAR